MLSQPGRISGSDAPGSRRTSFLVSRINTSDAVFPPELYASPAVFQPDWVFPVRVSPRRTVGKAKERSATPRKTVLSKSKAQGSASLGGTRAKVQERSPALQKPIQSKSESRSSASPGKTRAKSKERSPASPKAVQSMPRSPGSASPGETHKTAKDRRGGRASGP